MRSIGTWKQLRNWCAGVSGCPAPSQPNAEHSRFQQRVRRCVQECRPGDFSCTVDEALRALLKAHGVYEDVAPVQGNMNLAPFEKGKLSLPASVNGCRPIHELLPDRALSYLEGEGSRMLRSSTELLEAEDQFGRARTYMDPVPAHNRSAYREFVKDLQSRALVGFTLAPLVEVGIFCVAKKSGQLRLIIGARRIVTSTSSRRLRSLLPHLRVSASSSVRVVDRIFISTVDVADCFHRMRMPPWLTRYFCLPSLTAAEPGLTEVDGVKVEGSQLVHTCCLCLPMGFSWSLYFAQSIIESVSGSVLALSIAVPLSAMRGRDRPLRRRCNTTCMWIILAYSAIHRPQSTQLWAQLYIR